MTVLGINRSLRYLGLVISTRIDSEGTVSLHLMTRSSWLTWLAS